MGCVLARPKFPRQINYRLTDELMAALDAESERRNISRNQVITEACEQFLAGPTAAPAVIGGSSVDQGARDALQALLLRVEAMENELQEIRDRQTEAIETAKEVHSDFASRFTRG